MQSAETILGVIQSYGMTLESRVHRKLARPVRRGALGKGQSKDRTSPAAYPTSRTVLRGGDTGNGGSLLDVHVGGKKQPYYFHKADGSPMALAVLWEKWKAPGEENLLETFTILTTSANELVADVHDRMPVILQLDDYNFWLNKNMHDPEQLKTLYRPFSAEMMRARKVSDLVNSPRFDGPSCILPV